MLCKLEQVCAFEEGVHESMGACRVPDGRGPFRSCEAQVPAVPPFGGISECPRSHRSSQLLFYESQRLDDIRTTWTVTLLARCGNE